MRTPRLLATLGLGLGLTTSVATAEVNQPLSFNDRPRTTPHGQTTIGIDITRLNIIGDAQVLLARPGDTFFLFGPGLSVRHGVSEKLEVGLGYATSLEEIDLGDSILSAEVNFTVVDNGQLSGAVGGNVGITTEESDLTPLRIGFEGQYKLTPQVALYTPGEQLTIGLSGIFEDFQFLSLPIGARFQAAPAVNLYAQTNLALIGLSDGLDSQVLLADFIPLTLGGWFSLPKLDLGLDLSFYDLSEETLDASALTFQARVHI